MKLTDDQITERYATLPANVKAVIYAPEINNTLYEIGKNQGLSHEDATVFIDSAHMILVKLVPPSEAASFLAQTLELKQPLAAALVTDIRAAIISQYQRDYDALKELGATPPKEIELQMPTLAEKPAGASQATKSWRQFIEENTKP